MIRKHRRSMTKNMKPTHCFSKSILDAVRKGNVIGIRAGSRPHRVIGIWAVVVDGRIFVRSWSLSRRGWYRTFLEEPRGTVYINDRPFAIRAMRTRSERVKNAVDRAYEEKYNTPGSIKYVKDLKRAKSRATTLELIRV